jgi:anti-anti-sigma factor
MFLPLLSRVHTDDRSSAVTAGSIAEITHWGGRCVVTVTGDIDLSNAEDLSAVAIPVIQSSTASEVALDLGAVSFIDSSGLGALLLIRNAAQERGLAVRLTRTSSQVRRLLEITGLKHEFRLDPSEEATETTPPRAF